MFNKQNKLDYYLKITLIIFFLGLIITHISPELPCVLLLYLI